MFKAIASEFTVPAKKKFIKQEIGPLSQENVKFICRMVISELMELASTVVPDPVQFVKDCSDTDLPKKYTGKDDKDKLAAQCDAVIDMAYYLGDTIKVNTGLPEDTLDLVFEKVHAANLKKVFPDGEFHTREDGKVIKPEGWKEPDLIPLITSKMEKM